MPEKTSVFFLAAVLFVATLLAIARQAGMNYPSLLRPHHHASHQR